MTTDWKQPFKDWKQPCKDLNGVMSFADMFRPVFSDEVITDAYGYDWKQETAGGWRRIEDQFFILMGPNGKFYRHKCHSVEAIKNDMNKKILESSEPPDVLPPPPRE